MKSRLTSIGVSIIIVFTGLSRSAIAQEAKGKRQERIGIYDSRAVAMAYGGTIFPKRMDDLKAQYKKAKEAGDAKEVARLEAEGPAAQEKLHKQGFSTAPVDDLLAVISAQLPKIKETVGVSILVSKWDKPELEKHPKAEQVDVTMKLVDAFHPDAGARKNAIEIQAKKPVPLDQVDKHKD